MYGRATFAIDVSSSSMNVASVTVTAMNHGLMRLLVRHDGLLNERPLLARPTFRAATRCS